MNGVECRTYDHPEQFLALLKADLEEKIKQAAAERAAQSEDSSTTTSNPHVLHAHANQASYVLPPSLEQLRDQVLGSMDRKPVAIVGRSGTGKSSLMAHMLLHWVQDPTHQAFVHFTGLAGPKYV